MSLVAGWYDDPDNHLFVRWWDGINWTDKYDFKRQENPNNASGHDDALEPSYQRTQRYIHNNALVGIDAIPSNRTIVLPRRQNLVPVLDCDDYPILRRLAPGKTYRFTLAHESWHEYDRYALAIKHKKARVGYASPAQARHYSPYVDHLRFEGCRVLAYGRVTGTRRNKTLMMELPKPEEMEFWLRDGPQHRREEPPHVRIYGASTSRMGDHEAVLHTILKGKRSAVSMAFFEVYRNDGDELYTISVVSNGGIIAEVTPETAKNVPEFYRAVLGGVRTGRVVIDRKGNRDQENPLGLRVVMTVAVVVD